MPAKPSVDVKWGVSEANWTLPWRSCRSPRSWRFSAALSCASQHSTPSAVEWKQDFFIQPFSATLPTKTGSLTLWSLWWRGWHILQAGYRSFFKSYSKFAELEVYLFKFFRLSYINMSKAAWRCGLPEVLRFLYGKGTSCTVPGKSSYQRRSMDIR